MNVIVDDFEFEILKLFKERGILKIGEVHQQFAGNPALYKLKGRWDDINTTIFAMNQSCFLSFLNPFDPDLIVTNHMYNLSDVGKDLLLFNEQYREKLEMLSDLQMRKLKVDIVNSEQTLKSYPWTQRLAWSGAIIAVILLIIKILEVVGVIHPSQ